MPQASPPAGLSRQAPAALPPRQGTAHRWVWAVLTIGWIAACGAGLWTLWAWDHPPGAAAQARAEWPADAGLARDRGGPTLVMLVHPQCTCSRASLDELAELLARARPRPKTFVLFLKPAGVADGWERSDLWDAAVTLPGVTVIRDDQGVQAARFGAATSGQTFLYDAHGRLQFSGGITAARAHAGDNAGRRAVVALLNGAATPPPARTNVFGCPLFDRPEARTF
jgi:hypothetical protein